MGSISPILSPEERKLSGKAKEKAIAKCTAWKLEVACGVDKNGRRVRHTKTVHGTKTEAKRELAQFESYWGVRKIEDRTLKSYCEEYIRRKEGTIQDTSIQALMTRIRVLYYIFGEDTKLSELTPEVIDNGMKELLTKGGESGKPCQASYVGAIKSCLASILLDAFKHGCLARDPIPDTQYYSAKAPKRDIPPTAELITLLSHVDPRDCRQMALLLVLCLGLRRQEAAALQWSDIDYEHNRISIKHTARWVEGKERVVEMTKTEASRRDLPIPTFLPELLEKRRASMEDDIALLLRTGELEERPNPLYVCTNEKGKRTSLTSITKWWCNHRAGFGFTCSLHDLRHAYITMLAEAGRGGNKGDTIHPVVAAKLAGHSSVNTTLSIYSHANWDKQVEAVESVEGIFLFNTKPWERRGEDQTDRRAITRRERLAAGIYEDDDPDLEEEADYMTSFSENF